MQAVIRIGGKQLVVAEGQTFYAEIQDQTPDSTFAAPEVLMVFGGSDAAKVGAPLVSGATVTLKVLDHGKHNKVRSIRFKKRKAVHKIIGHRQPYTWLQVESIK